MKCELCGNLIEMEEMDRHKEACSKKMHGFSDGKFSCKYAEKETKIIEKTALGEILSESGDGEVYISTRFIENEARKIAHFGIKEGEKNGKRRI